MQTSNRRPRRSVLSMISLPLVLAACSSGGGGGGGAPAQTGGAAFLDNESRLDSGGASNAGEPEFHAAGSRAYVAFVDDRNGPLELFVNASSDGGKTWRAQDAHVPGVAGGPLGVDSTGTKLAFDGAHLVTVFEESDDMMVNVSHDGGLTWKAVASRLDPGLANEADSDDQTVLFGHGAFHAVWEDQIDGRSDVYYSASTDMGETWSTARRISPAPAGASTADEISMAIADSGDLYVAWADDVADVDGNRDIYVVRSTDGGATWTGGTSSIATPGTESYSPVIACAGGSVHVAYIDDRAGDLNVYYRRSADGGASWSGAGEVRLDQTDPGLDVEEVHIAADGERVVVGWKSKTHGSDDVYLDVSSDGGATWLAEPLRLDMDDPGDGDSDDLQIAVEGATIVATWEDGRSGIDDLYLRYSRDGGATWSGELLVQRTPAGTDDASRPSLALSNGQAWVAWQDDRHGSQDVYVNGGALPQQP